MDLLREIQIDYTKKRIFLMDEDYRVFFDYPIGTDYWEGKNEYGQPYSNAEEGVYDIDLSQVYTDGKYQNDGSRDLNSDVMPYGWAFIKIDDRGRAIHGGSSNLGYPKCDSPFQFTENPDPYYTKTLGCNRANNADVYYTAQKVKQSFENGIKPQIHVVK